jgi:hypothetical protein
MHMERTPRIGRGGTPRQFQKKIEIKKWLEELVTESESY